MSVWKSRMMSVFVSSSNSAMRPKSFLKSHLMFLPTILQDFFTSSFLIKRSCEIPSGFVKFWCYFKKLIGPIVTKMKYFSPIHFSIQPPNFNYFLLGLSSYCVKFAAKTEEDLEINFQFCFRVYLKTKIMYPLSIEILKKKRKTNKKCRRLKPSYSIIYNFEKKKYFYHLLRPPFDI